ncbi:MAG: hypothetical protein AVDCRST_MAG48-1965, partial [uncultured Friedmanniella sp.]
DPSHGVVRPGPRRGVGRGGGVPGPRPRGAHGDPRRRGLHGLAPGQPEEPAPLPVRDDLRRRGGLPGLRRPPGAPRLRGDLLEARGRRLPGARPGAAAL